MRGGNCRRGQAIQKVLATSEPIFEQLEVGERALAELLR